MGNVVCGPVMRACISVSSLDESDIAEPFEERYRLGTPSPPPEVSYIQFTDL